METKVNLPDMGEGVESAVVVSILVSKGDEVQVDQGIVELETDKAVAEVPSPKAGKVKDIHVEKGQNVKPGEPLLTLDQPDEEKNDSTDEQDQQDKPESKEDKSKEEPGQNASKDESPQPKEKKFSDEKESSDSTGTSSSSPKQEASKSSDAKGDTENRSESSSSTDIPAAPSVRRLAREFGVDLASISGSGEGGWITEADVKSAARETSESSSTSPRDGWGPIQRAKITTTRKTIARKMHESHIETARVTHFDDADVTELESVRREHKSQFAEEGIHLTMLPFVLRSLVEALGRHPLLNASLDMDTQEIVYKDYISIGVAVDSEQGLIVPVLRDVDKLSIAQTAHGIEELVRKVKNNEFQSADLRGGTFTVSNVGAIGGRYATPIILPPQSAILLLGRATPQPVVRDDAVTVRTILPLSLTYDHRIVDGAEAARFLNDVIDFLKDPIQLLTH